MPPLAPALADCAALAALALGSASSASYAASARCKMELSRCLAARLTCRDAASGSPPLRQHAAAPGARLEGGIAQAGSLCPFLSRALVVEDGQLHSPLVASRFEAHEHANVAMRRGRRVGQLSRGMRPY